MNRPESGLLSERRTGLLSERRAQAGDVEKAAVAEQRVIDAIRALGYDVLTQWAAHQQAAQATACQATPGVNVLDPFFRRV